VRGQGTGDHNELSGTVQGTAVQAGAIHGGVHIRMDGAGFVSRVPWQLPPTVPLTDRRDALLALEQHREHLMGQGHSTAAVVSGLGGVGKTAVALTWLHRLREACPDGQLFADLGAQSPDQAADPAQLLSRFLGDLGVPAERIPLSVGDRTVLYRSLTAERRIAVLLDDAATAAQVRPLLPGGANVVAVTSRWRLPGLAVDGCRQVQIEPLERDAAVELLATTLGDDRVEGQREDAGALVDLCAGLPLAVRVAGARLAVRPTRRIHTMVRALTEERSRLEVLAVSDDYDVRAALDLSYRGLPPEGARLYRLLGLHPGREFSSEAAAAVLGGSTDRAGHLLDLLHDASLLTEAHEERHRFHDLVRLHAAAKAVEEETTSERSAAQRRIADHYLAGATLAEELIEPRHRLREREYGPGPLVLPRIGGGGAGAGTAVEGNEGGDAGAALDWLERELPNLMAVLRQARPAGIPAVGWQLADALWPLFVRRKHYELWREAYEEGLLAAHETGDEEAECRMLTSGGLAELDTGGHRRALEKFERAARLFGDADNQLGHARTLNYRGIALQGLGRLCEAARLFEEAAVLLPLHGDRRAGGLARFNLAEIALTEGRVEEAVGYGSTAHSTLTDEGDLYNAARAAILLGRAHILAHGDLGAAERWLSAALAVLRSTSAYETARAVQAQAQLAELQGEVALARERYQEALDLYSTVRLGGEHTEAVRSRLRHLTGPYGTDGAAQPGGPEEPGAPGGRQAGDGSAG
jgi:tetratricopeptide (TPR) repeat protein